MVVQGIVSERRTLPHFLSVIEKMQILYGKVICLNLIDMIASKTTPYASILFLAALFLSAAIYINKSTHQQKILVAKEIKALLLFLPTDVGDRKYSTQALLEEVSHKKIIFVKLKGDPDEDRKRFEFIRQEARRLEYTNDTASVIHVRFPKESTYGQFVYLTDMMQEEKHKRYGITGDDFYIFGENPPEQ